MKKLILVISILLLILTACGKSADQKPEAAKKADPVVVQSAPTKSKAAETTEKEDKPVVAEPVSEKKSESKREPISKSAVLAKPKTFYVSVSSANVRNGPGTAHKSIHVVTKGTTLIAEKETKSETTPWYYISKHKGWISSAVLTTKKPVKAVAPKATEKSPKTKTTTKKPDITKSDNTKPNVAKPTTPEKTVLSTTAKLLSKAKTRYNSTQAMIVTAKSASSYHATLNAYAYRNGKWTKVYSMPAAVGKRGITTAMHEGGMRSPAGIYYIGRAFGEVSRPTGVKLSYTKTDSLDYWIDDPESADYNKWKVYSGKQQVEIL